MSRGGIQGFQPERLSQVLATRRLTQVQLAAMVGVSTATISKWRAGAQAPARDKLDRLASVVNATPDWFTRPPAPPTSTPLFRSNASAHVAAREMLQGRLVWSQDVALALSEFVDYVPLNVPTRDFTDPEEITSQDIEEAAADCRSVWRLGRATIQDTTLAVESAGIIVIREETGVPQIEGLSAWSAALERPFILLSSDKDNGYRSRFDLAHELGHIVLHRAIMRTGDRERHNLLETQAHRFAGAFLLPAETFAAEVAMPTTLDDLLLLKRRWGVSVAAIIMRLLALKLISDEGARTLFKRRSARWGAKAEPGDGDRTPETPRVLRRTIELLIDENVMPLEMIPQHVGLSAHDIESIAGLPESYFESKERAIKLSKLRTPSFGSRGTVVPFPPTKKNRPA